MNIVDPIIAQATADGVVKRAATDLAKLLRQLTLAFDPFPGFMGMETLQAIEVEIPGSVAADKGCVVVCPDGELYELVLSMIPGPVDVGGFEQTDELKALDLTPGERVAYLYAAVHELGRILGEREG